jgi:hypothetical protein
MHHRQFSKTRRAFAAASGLALLTALVAATPAEVDRTGQGRPSNAEVTVVPVSADLRITRTTADGATDQETQHLYRDSVGRTRTETGSTVTIYDPTTATTLVLDSATRSFQRTTRAKSAPAGDSAKRNAADDQKTTSEPRSLGTATVSGVPAEGRQYTVTLPAVRDLPVRTKDVTLWLSTKVQLPVRTTVVEDSGAVNTQTYTNIKAGAEPAAELFAAPAGYREVKPGAAKGNGLLANCPLQNDDPVFLTSFDLAYLDARYVNAITDPGAGCVFVFDQLVLLDYPLNAFPTTDLLLPFDQWLVYDNGGFLPYLPYVAFADIVFVAGNPVEPDTTTKDSFITLTVFPI